MLFGHALVRKANMTTKFILTMNGDDTVINSKTWKKVMMRYVEVTGSEYVDIAQEPDRFYAGLREDNKRVYVSFPDYNTPINCDTNKDRLLYDFNLGVGDTVPNLSIRGNGGMHVIKAIDGVLIGTKYHRTYHLTGGFEPAPSIIEGVGTSAGLFHYRNIMWSTPFFGCFSHQQVLYKGNTNKVCGYIYEYGTPTSVLGIEHKDDIKIYPNPVYDKLNIEAANAISVRIYNNTGSLVTQQNIERGKLTLDVSAFPAGIYFMDLKGKEGNVIDRQKWIKY
jgi:hypothetical protein